MRSGEYAGVDWFRLPAALLVIAIHTAPLSGISPGLDAAVTYGLGRLAVPFFFMTTGYFLIGPCLLGKKGSRERYGRFEIKMLILYGAASVLYLPVAWYAGNLPKTPGELARMVLFDGMFYHLWYFPALLLGGRIARGLGRLGKEKALALAGGLYLAGLLGDSYYGLTAQIPHLKAGYEALFQIMGYTRNGLFFAPLFLLLGAYMKKPEKDGRRTGRVSKDAGRKTLTAAGVPMTLTAGVPMALTAGILMTEAFLVFRLGLARHDSMYLSLPAAMYVWYQGLLLAEGSAPRWLRDGTLCVYVIHPLVIILVRGAAKYTGTAALLVENPMVHYLAVCAGSLAAAALYFRRRQAAEAYPPGSPAASAKRGRRRRIERTKKERG